MRYVCLGYVEEHQWDAIPPDRREALMAECRAYDEQLRHSGHIVAAEALQSARNAATLRWRDGKVLVSDGPFAGTQEQLGRIIVLEAVDLNHAIRLMSQYPGVRVGGCVEVRPVEANNAGHD